MQVCKLKGIGINVRVQASHVIGGLWWTTKPGERCDMTIFFPGETYFKYEPWTENGYLVYRHGGGFYPDIYKVYFDADDFKMFFEDLTWEQAFDELTEEIFKD